MYETFFAMRTRAFPSLARADLYVPVAAIEDARKTALRSIQRAEGLAMIIGPSGTGKTMLCQVLAQQLADELDVVVLSSARLGTRRALLQAVLYHLQQPYRGMDENELRLALMDYANSENSKPNGIALLVDEAHTLPLRLLDELRMMTNLAVNGQPRIRLLLAGSALVEERMASPKLDSFAQRVTARCYLEPFNRMETQEYVGAQLAMAGSQSGDVFSDEACLAVHRATDGVPRLINQVCDHAMLLAFADGKRRIEARDVEDAWADLQQLPARVADEPHAETSGGVIEFGSLDDGSEAFASAAETGSEAVPATDFAEDDCDSLEAGPAEKVEQIQQMVARLDDDFRPAGALRPEVEICFDGPLSLLAEPFEEEEVICDRFGATNPKHRWAERPSPRQPVAPSGGNDDFCLSIQPRREHVAERTFEIAPEGERDLHATVAASSVETVPEKAAEKVAEAAATDDRDETAGPHVRALNPNRKQQYRQLFARLRRA
jgi:type II secretory pathway predicted ATPase ExeA